MFLRCIVSGCRLASIAAATLALVPLAAQEESAADRQYREDYERVQKIVAITDTARRSDQILAFLKERPGSKLADYAQSSYLLVLEGYSKSENFKTLLTAAERLVQVRPKAPEGYYFYGLALRHANRNAGAFEALARCSVVRNPLSRKARDLLEFAYRAENKGVLGGLDKILKKAQADMAP
jgi:hypothetical protein